MAKAIVCDKCGVTEKSNTAAGIFVNWAFMREYRFDLCENCTRELLAACGVKEED